jgi:hypothetical protein
VKELKMKTIRCWEDISHYGIVPLTGKACGLSYRILCDVTAQGKRILEKAFDIAELPLRESWNSGRPEAPHVGCIMLAPDLLPFLAVFALLEVGCREAWLTQGNGVVGVESSDSPERVDAFKQFHRESLVRRFAYAGTAGDRNQHVMSGRIH